MKEEKSAALTPERLADAKVIVDVISAHPQEQRAYAVTMGAAYMSGLKDGRAMALAERGRDEASGQF